MTEITSEKSQPEASLPGQQDKAAHLDDGKEVDKNPPKVDTMPPQSGGDRRQRRGFCSPILIFFSTIGSLFAGMLSLSASAGQGMAKFYWHIPVLYGDKTIREWPEITGFKSGCAAGGKSLVYGFYDGITGVVTLPYKGARGAGLKGLGIGILHGFGGLVLKPLTGIWGFIGHPIFGLHKHVSNRKGNRQQQDPSSLV